MKMRWKNVLYLLCFIMISLSVYSDDNTEENENKSEEIIRILTKILKTARENEGKQ